MAAGTILDGHIGYCGKDPSRPLEALGEIEAKPDELVDMPPATIAAGSQDCKAVETAMTKCSTWLPGHDKAAAARAPVPAPAELKADVDALASWVAAIRNRRG